MRKIFVVLSVVVFLGWAKFSFADEAARKQLVEKLLTVMKSEEQYKKTMEQSKKSQQEMLKTMPGAAENAADISKQVDDMMSDDFSYESMRPDIITVYAEVFTEQELQGLIDFYSSEIGQSFVKKTPQMTARLMELSQKRMQKVMQKSQLKMQEAMEKKMENQKEGAEIRKMPQDQKAP